MIPKDPVILLSFVNTQLRDNYRSLSEFCNQYNVMEEEITSKLEEINYTYSDSVNQFI
ncbi:MAG: DUF4250 domain-containing protein [Clostridia bacterium]|nr:DUF4250 domain-containing protein [Clostridia bacterium]